VLRRTPERAAKDFKRNLKSGRRHDNLQHQTMMDAKSLPSCATRGLTSVEMIFGPSTRPALSLFMVKTVGKGGFIQKGPTCQLKWPPHSITRFQRSQQTTPMSGFSRVLPVLGAVSIGGRGWPSGHLAALTGGRGWPGGALVRVCMCVETQCNPFRRTLSSARGVDRFISESACTWQSHSEETHNHLWLMILS